MILNSEEEIRAYYAGRLTEAERWGWWKDGHKWCGLSQNSPTALQDVRSELERDMESVLDNFRRTRKDVATAGAERSDPPEQAGEVPSVLRLREEAAGVLPNWLR